MQTVLAYFDPTPLRGLFLPDQDLTVIGAGGQDVAILRVGPRDLPDRARMPDESHEGDRRVMKLKY
jgi:hypothetical protein